MQELMTNLAGHDIEAVLEAFGEAALSDEPTCFIAYTIKGFGLPFAGHQENHAGLLNPEEVENLRGTMGIEPGREWDKFAGLSVDKEELQAFIASAPFSQAGTGAHDAPRVSLPPKLPMLKAESISTQDAFGRIMFDIAGSESDLARSIMTTSPPARSASAGVRHGCLRDMTHKRRGPCDVSSAITASPSTNLSVKALDFVEWWALWDSNPGPTD